MIWTPVSDQSNTWTEIDRVNENLIPYSENFSLLDKIGATVNENVITDSSTTQAQQLYVGNIDTDLDAYVSRCFSATVKKDNVSAVTRFGRLRISYNLAAAASDLHFDTSTGDVHNINYGSVENVDFGVIDEGDNWRFWQTSKFNGTLYRIGFFPAAGYTTITLPGTVLATGSITLINLQFETGTSPSRYLATNGTPVSWEVQ